MTAPPGVKKGLGLLACVAVFGAFFVCLSTPVSEPDFWWHLASGRAMVEQGSFLRHDPFTLEGDLGNDESNTAFILTYSWLSQVAFFEVFERFGIGGVVFLFAAIHAAMFACLFRLMRRFGADTAPSLAFVGLAFVAIVFELRYNVARPQAWSGLLAVLLVHLLEEAKAGGRRSAWALAPLMALWSNLHGGFILGDLLLVLYAAGAAIARDGSRRFYLAVGAAFLASGLNPNGFKAALSFPVLGPLAASAGWISDAQLKALLDSIVENQSLLDHASLAGILHRLPFLSAFVVLSIGSFLLLARTPRRIRPDHLLLFAVLLVMGVRSIRYLVFFVSIGAFVTVVNLRRFAEGFRGFADRRAAALAMAGIYAALAWLAWPTAAAHARTSYLASGVACRNPYGGALDFMRRCGLRGNVFNDYNAGGPIIWSLSPGIKVFVDGRALHPKAMQIQREVMNIPLDRPGGWGIPLYKLAFEMFRIDYVLVPGCDAVSGKLIKLVPALLEDPGWRLVYADGQSLLFVRDVPAHRDLVATFGKPPAAAYENILSMAEAASGNGHARRMNGWRLSKAVALAGLGEKDAASRVLGEYLAAAPLDRYALALRDRLASAGPPRR